MLEPEHGEIQGVPALRRLALDVESWPQEAKDWQWCARFAYQVIERRGTGGGNFRLLYADFLDYAAGRAGLPGLAPTVSAFRTLASDWTDLSSIFLELSEGDASGALWRDAAARTAALADAEQHAWQSVDRAVA